MKDPRPTLQEAANNAAAFWSRVDAIFRKALGLPEHSQATPSKTTPGPTGILLITARQQGKTIHMHQLLFQDAVKTHDTPDGRRIAIHRTPDSFTDRCKVTITRRLPYSGGPILQKTLNERFPSVDAAMRHCQFIFGITEWNGQ